MQKDKQSLTPRPKIASFIVLLVCLAGVLRIGSLVRPHYPPAVPDPDSIQAIARALVTDSANLDPLLSAAGVRRVDRLRFDGAAAVVLTCGVDRKPGQADRDDNFDQIVDDSRELGAVGSDDQCVAPWEPEYAAAVQQPGTSTISTGAFVSNGNEPDEHETRFVLSGPSGDDSWSWLVIP